MDKGFQKSWRLILITMCLMIAFSFLGLIPFLQRHYYAAICIGELSILIPAAIGSYMLRREKKDSCFRGFSPALIPSLVLIPFCMQVFLTYLTVPLQVVLTNLFGESVQDMKGAGSAGEFFVQILAVCAVPAVVEELLCRGVIMRMLKPYGMAVSMTISALAFTMLHFDIVSFPIIFMLGMLLAAVKIMTGSIWACILIHFSNNLSAVIALSVFSGGVNIRDVIFNIAALLIFPAALIYLLKKTKPNVVGLRDSEKVKTGFSAEMCICLLIFAGMTAFSAIR